MTEEEEFYVVKQRNLVNTNKRDVKKLYGTNFLDWRLEGLIPLNAQSSATKNKINPEEDKIIQIWYYMKISVYDTISEYTLAPGTTYTEEQRTQRIFSRSAWSSTLSGNIRFGFYHKLTSSYESVSSGGNKHNSYFYFKAGTSGELCPSASIESLNSDLGLRWVTVHVMKDIWSDEFTLTFRTNLMGSKCVVKNTDFGDNQYILLGDIFQVGSERSFIDGKPRIFYYHIQEEKHGNGGDLFIETDNRGAGYFSNSYAVFECPSPKVKVLEQCLDPPASENGCYHNSNPCLLCKKLFALDNVTGTCNACPSDCEYCVFDVNSSSTLCTICFERFTLSLGTCIPCSPTEVWDSKTFKCFPGTDLTLQSGYIYNGLTTPGNPFPNKTHLVIEAKFTVGPTGTYEQEMIKLNIDGDFVDFFQNITSPLFSYDENSYTFYVTFAQVEKFETLDFEFSWDSSSLDEVVEVNYVRVYAETLDLSQDCLIQNADGTCALCNKYRLKYLDTETGTCSNIDEGEYLSSSDYTKKWNIFSECSTDNSVKYCWDKDIHGGAVECYENNWLLIGGSCPACDGSCLGCTGDPVLNTTAHLNNCKACPPGATGLKVVSSNGTKLCVPCESLGCTSCPLDFQDCKACDSGYELKQGKCLKICDDGFFYDLEQLKCEKCHSNCKGCQNGGINGCLECSTGSLKSKANCTNPVKDFCCYSCPQECDDCSYNGVCSSCKDKNLRLDKNGKCVNNDFDQMKLVEIYFMKSKGEIVVVFDREFSIETLEGKYIIITDNNMKHSNCSLDKKITDECRINLLENTNEIKNEKLIFTVKENSVVENKNLKKNYIISGRKSVTITNINFYHKPGSTKGIETFGTASSISVSVASSTLLISDRFSFLQVLKLTQYIEFMLYFNIDFPVNLYTFLRYFNDGLYEKIKNPFEEINTKYCRTPQKFIENDASCYYFDNIGLEYIITGSLVLIKIVIFILGKISEKCRKDKNEKTFLMTVNAKFGSKVFVYVLDMFFFELVLFSSLQLKYLIFEDFYLGLNSILGIISIVVCVLYLTLVYIFSIVINKEILLEKNTKKLKFFERLPFKFFFEDINIDKFFGRYFVFVIQLKNFLNGFLVVFLHKNGLIQIIMHIIINGSFLGLLIWQNPYKTKFLYFKDITMNSLLNLTLIICILLTDQLRHGTEKFIFNFYGKGGIIIFSCLFIGVFLLGIYETIVFVIEAYKKWKNKSKVVDISDEFKNKYLKIEDKTKVDSNENRIEEREKNDKIGRSKSKIGAFNYKRRIEFRAESKVHVRKKNNV